MNYRSDKGKKKHKAKQKQYQKEDEVTKGKKVG
jgi:hypothetical protein